MFFGPNLVVFLRIRTVSSPWNFELLPGSEITSSELSEIFWIYLTNKVVFSFQVIMICIKAQLNLIFHGFIVIKHGHLLEKDLEFYTNLK